MDKGGVPAMPDEELIASPAQDVPEEVVGVPYSLFQSFLGKYYKGRTPGLFIKTGSNCWGGIINPRDFDADVFIDSISVSNTSTSAVCTRIWINSTTLGTVYVSPYVTPANTAAEPVRCPRAVLSYAQDLRSTPVDGASFVSRYIGPLLTHTQEFGGKLIIPPGGSCIVFCYAREPAGNSGQAAVTQSCEISVQWWEQQMAE
jgi:hypothetical protein